MSAWDNLKEMGTSSGRILYQADLDLLREWHRVGVVRYSEKPFTLRSGIQSHVYINAREDLTENPDVLDDTGAAMLFHARKVLSEKRDSRRPCFLGLPTAGTALALAASLASRDETRIHERAACDIVREIPKTTHGAAEHRGGWFLKYNPDAFHYFVLDNVVTDGGTKEVWAKRLLEDGYPAYDLDWMILVDRQQGGVEGMRRIGIKNVHVIYYLLDIAFAYGEMGLWPKEAVKQVEREIAAHQFV